MGLVGPDGKKVHRKEGRSPPLLSNLMLDVMDKELERRGPQLRAAMPMIATIYVSQSAGGGEAE